MDNVEKTQDYNKFRLLMGNRPIDRHHLKKLKESIIGNNRLNLHPIIVNQNYEVIDGQHRLEAARQLGIDIFFIKSDSINDEHLIECNVNQKSFEVDDYINFFCTKEKIGDYMELRQIMQQTGLMPKAVLTLILGNVSTEILNFLKTGKFRLPKDKNYERQIAAYQNFMSYVRDKRIRPLSMFTNHAFTKAFRWICTTNGFDLSLFLKKLDLRWFDLKPQRVSEEWYKLLLSIYNFKNHNRLEEEYALGK